MTTGRDTQVSRVLQVHTRYRQAGGEDQVVEAERLLLESAGVAVDQIIFDNADLRASKSAIGDLRLARDAIWSRSAERRVHEALLSHRPDVMHAHNTFLAASPSVYPPAKRLGIPVVQTLHNYRLVCPAATAFRDERPCLDCLGRSIAWPGVVHACVRESHAQSALIAATIALHRARGTFRLLDAYIALTEFQRDVLIAGGLAADRMHVLGNFLEPDPGQSEGSREGMLFVGRLSPEKGIRALVAAAALAPGLISVIGDGPLAPLVAAAQTAGHLRWLGPLGRGDVLEHVRRCVAVVLPSIWYEGFPLVVLEAYASGTPVIASGIGSLQEIVRDGVTGTLVPPGDVARLAAAIRWSNEHRTAMRSAGQRARDLYLSRYRGPTHLAGLLDVYSAANGGDARS